MALTHETSAAAVQDRFGESVDPMEILQGAYKHELHDYLLILDADLLERNELQASYGTRADFAGYLTRELLKTTEIAEQAHAYVVEAVAQEVGEDFRRKVAILDNLDRAGDYFDEYIDRGMPVARPQLIGQIQAVLDAGRTQATAGHIYASSAEFCRQVWVTMINVAKSIDESQI